MAKSYQHKLANFKSQLQDLMHGLDLFKVNCIWDEYKDCTSWLKVKQPRNKFPTKWGKKANQLLESSCIQIYVVCCKQCFWEDHVILWCIYKLSHKMDILMNFMKQKHASV
jgi:hypothetical protein